MILESKYLLVQNVHALGVTQELLQQFALYGDIEWLVGVFSKFTILHAETLISLLLQVSTVR